MTLTPRMERRAAWVVFAATAAMWIAAIVTTWLTRDLSGPNSVGEGGTNVLLTVATGVMLLMFPISGIVISTRRPGNRVGWLLLAVGAGWGLLSAATGYADYGLRLHPGSLPAADVAGALTLSVWAIPVGLTGTLLLLLFPDGRLPGPRWRWAVAVGVAAIATSTLTGLLEPGLMENSGYPHTENPLGSEGLRVIVDVGQYAVLVLALTMLASAASLVFRFRRAGPVEREQVKWLAAAAAASASIYLADLCISLLSGGSGPQPTWRVLLDDVFILSVGLMPIAIGIAVMRYRLYEIDVIIRRTLVYAALVSVLALLYFAGVFGIQAAVRSVSGQSGTLAVTVSTLLVAAAFQPARGRIQRAVDHRFYRARYDAGHTLEAFSGRLREQVDIETVSGEVLEVVRETLRPAHATLWIRPGEPER